MNIKDLDKSYSQFTTDLVNMPVNHQSIYSNPYVSLLDFPTLNALEIRFNNLKRAKLLTKKAEMWLKENEFIK